jgi:hypothetical protein
MTSSQIQYSIETGRLKLGNWDKLSHYGIVGLLLIIPCLFVFSHLKDYLAGTPQYIMPGERWFMIIPSILGLLFYRLQRNRLKFKMTDTHLTREQLGPVIKKVADELGWVIEKDNKKIIIARTHPGFFSGSWGEQIIILFSRNKVLVNSICDPQKRSSVVSMGRNKRNMRRLIVEIEAARR